MFFAKKSRRESLPFDEPEKLPKHVAVIMDGNGRWAQKKGMPRIAGHRQGRESLRNIIKNCVEFGIPYLTVYAFSTENWNRPKEEVEALMELFSQALDQEIKELDENQIKINFFGRIQMFPEELQKKIKQAEEQTSGHKRLTVNIMASYGSRAEIVDAVKKIIKSGLPESSVTEEVIGNNLYTAGLPDPDLLIRTASEMRVSNFLLWQIAYAELYVTSVLWPDFDKKQFIAAIKQYLKRERKFGKTK
jgi:undecaprenyl diphosphate synthase